MGTFNIIPQQGGRIGGTGVDAGVGLLLPGAVDELEQQCHHDEEEVEDAVDLPEVGTQHPQPSHQPHLSQLSAVTL